MKLYILIAIAAVVVVGCSAKSEPSAAPEQTSTASSPANVQKATITIDGGSYNPSVVTVERGKPVELTFVGGKELGCGGTIVLKSLNMTKSVESGKSVTFTFTPEAAGDIPITCGMDMYDGKVVVK